MTLTAIDVKLENIYFSFSLATTALCWSSEEFVVIGLKTTSLWITVWLLPLFGNYVMMNAEKKRTMSLTDCFTSMRPTAIRIFHLSSESHIKPSRLKTNRRNVLSPFHQNLHATPLALHNTVFLHGCLLCVLLHTKPWLAIS